MNLISVELAGGSKVPVERRNSDSEEEGDNMEDTEEADGRH